MCSYMYDLLTNRMLVSNNVPILVAFTKTDLPASLADAAIVAQLEKEMYALNNMNFP